MDDLLSGRKLENNIVDDMRVQLADEFDKNFVRKAFFSRRWKPRKDTTARGSLLIVTGALRRSIKNKKLRHGVSFTSSLAYANIHNEGGKGRKPVREHTRRSRKGKTYHVRAHTRAFNMTQRQFIGDGPETQKIIKGVIDDNLRDYNNELAKFLRK